MVAVLFSDELRALVGAKTGLPTENILIAVTHTHCGPNTSGVEGWGEIDRSFVDSILIPAMCKSAVDAIADMVPADAGISTVRPIDTGKHVYSNWTPIMNKFGALHPAMDPFKMEANKDLQHNYSTTMCPNTLDYLSRTVYLNIDPDMDKNGLDAIIAALI